jgi:hypothetical protein
MGAPASDERPVRDALVASPLPYARLETVATLAAYGAFPLLDSIGDVLRL